MDEAALVLSGGGVTGLMLQLGFLKRLQESDHWASVRHVYGTSAGAMAGAMAALDRIDLLEEFLLSLQPEDTFKQNPLWRLPLLGSHIYTLPETVEQRIGPLHELAEALISSERELTVIVTDLTPGANLGERQMRLCERAYAARSCNAEEFAEALFASAAISIMVSPLAVGGRVATDGAWVRNFPLGYAYANPKVGEIISFRYEPQELQFASDRLERYAKRLGRLGPLKPARSVRKELEAAIGRAESGHPLHTAEMFARLMQITVLRNTTQEEMQAEEKEQALSELASLREAIERAVARRRMLPWQRRALQEEIATAFAVSSFPFIHDRAVPRINVVARSESGTLESSFQRQQPWPLEQKRQLIEHGYELCDAALAA